MVSKLGLRTQTPCVQICALILKRYVNLWKILNLSVPRYPDCKMDNKGTYLIRVVMWVKCVKICEVPRSDAKHVQNAINIMIMMKC